MTSRGNDMNTTFLPRRRVAIATLAALGILTAGVIGLRTSTAQPSGSPGAPQAMPVMVATVQESEVALWDEVSGRLEAVERADVRSRVAGALPSIPPNEAARLHGGHAPGTNDAPPQ